jgi:hypothetical protein
MKKKKGTGKFWIGKGTLGKVRQNQEIPQGYISDKRMEELSNKGLIGERLNQVVPVKTKQGQPGKKKNDKDNIQSQSGDDPGEESGGDPGEESGE